MSTQPDTSTNDALDTGDTDDLAHLFCASQESTDRGSVARCGKRKDEWRSAPPTHPTCIVCFTMMQTGTCSHCIGAT